MHYILLNITDELLFIKWYRSPSEDTKPQEDYVDDLRARMDASEFPLYFLSDLREGRIMDVSIIQRLGRLTHHPNYGAGTAFSKDVFSSMFVGVFSRFAKPEKGESVFYDKMEDSLAYLESFKPGLAHDIDWGAALARLP
jgi:hypothetical protein